MQLNKREEYNVKFCIYRPVRNQQKTISSTVLLRERRYFIDCEPSIKLAWIQLRDGEDLSTDEVGNF